MLGLGPIAGAPISSPTWWQTLTQRFFALLRH